MRREVGVNVRDERWDITGAAYPATTLTTAGSSGCGRQKKET